MSPIAVALGVAALAAVLVLLDRMAGRIVRPVPRPIERTVPELGVEHEDLAIPSGTHQLAAWLLHPERPDPARPLVLLAHGWAASHGTVLRLGEPLVRAGYQVLLFDVRGHGRNEPAPFVTIRHFRDDVIAVALWAAERFPERKRVLVGHSLGGSAGVLAAAEGAPLDGLVLVASPSDVVQVTAEFLNDRGLPGAWMVRLFRPFWWRRVGGTFGPLTPHRRIAEVTVPMVIVQPEHDKRVHPRHADQLAAASGLVVQVILEREHTDVLEAPETLRLVEDLLRRVGSATSAARASPASAGSSTGTASVRSGADRDRG